MIVFKTAHKYLNIRTNRLKCLFTKDLPLSMEEELQKIKHILAGNQSILEQQNSDFFEDQQLKLSLSLMKITSKAQLQPLLKQYSQRMINESTDKIKLTACKYLLLYKHNNLQSAMQSKYLHSVREDVYQNINLLDKPCLQSLLRYLVQHKTQTPPPLPLIDHKSSSQLLVLLFLVYPQEKDAIWNHYKLTQDIIYDPLNLLIVLKQLPQRQFQLQGLIEKAFISSESQDQFMQNNIASLKDKQERAIIFAINNGLIEIVQKYYVQKDDFNSSFTFQHANSVFEAIILQNYKNPKIFQICSKIILQKSRNNDEFQNAQYIKLVANVLKIFYKKNDQLKCVQNLINLIFDLSKWKINFQQFNFQQLFSCIVLFFQCRKEGLKQDQKAIFIKCLTLIKEWVQQNTLAEEERKKLSFIVLFAVHFDLHPYLSSSYIAQQMQKIQNLDVKRMVAIKKLIQE